MRRILHILSIFLLCSALSAPAVFAQRHGGANNGHRTERTNRGTSPSRGGNHSRPSQSRPTQGRPNNGGSRPGINGGNHGNNNRPNHGGNVGNRPDNKPGKPNVGNRPGGNNRPEGNRPGINGGNHGNNNRPNHGGNVGNRPGGNHRPEGGRPGINNQHRPNRPGAIHRPGHNHGYRPGHGVRPPHMAPPHRPYRPVMHRPHYRPLPPPGWHPRRGIPVIHGILGLTFGTAINLSLDYLFNSGYHVDGYTNDIVYLRNVNALNYIWTDAALYYGTGGLDASSFYYSTPRYDLARYNSVYNSLVATYGVPVSINNTVNSMGATWFGGNNGYITLSFGTNNLNGGLRYLTTLTFGM